jgi:hypothetical protein
MNRRISLLYCVSLHHEQFIVGYKQYPLRVLLSHYLLFYVLHEFQAIKNRLLNSKSPLYKDL